MYLCRICKAQVVGDDRALWMHMRTHDIQMTTTTSPTYYHEDRVKGDNVQHKSSNEKDHLASSVVLLSNGSLKPLTLLIKSGSHVSSDGLQAKQPVEKPFLDLATHSIDDHQAKQPVEKPFLDQATHGGNKEGRKDLVDVDDEKANEVVRGIFECRACNKVFYSHQALGGHRASHKKIKGCFAAAYLNPDEKKATESRDANAMGTKHGNQSLNLDSSKPVPKSSLLHGSLSSSTPSKKKSKSHECSICHRVFPSGQALGGHKRCHWLPSSVSGDTPFYSISTFHNFLDEGQPLFKKTKFGTSWNSKPLDLNQLPLPFDELHKTPDDKIRVEVGSHIYGLRASVATNFLRERGIRRDINSIYHSFCQYNSSQEHYSLKGKNNDTDVNGRLKSIQLKNTGDNNIDGRLCSTWLQLGIGSS